MTHKRAAKQLGREIRRARVASGVSLRTFAAKLGVSPSYWSKVERGEVASGDLYAKAINRLSIDLNITTVGTAVMALFCQTCGARVK